ncbi:CAMK family protein kinase [Histomonas meleagridis]|uniref:CAMK family protein kinase n=1 Tax=Histomonas meleagridis TaxID=135588 RepID=UPI00355A9591|nr:CAMK family protein kinase [Histomonas meleagridis]KAH0802344.1 CAMK family protein kinase [Histomonas meleagridis]
MQQTSLGTQKIDPSGRYLITPLSTVGGFTINRASMVGHDKKVYTAKSIERQTIPSTNTIEMLKREFEILGSISHPLIQKFIEVSFDSKYHYQIVESEEVNLITYYEQDFPLIENTARLIFINLIEAVSFLHSHHIAHLDIRPDNVFVIDGKFKLGGFLFSQKYDEGVLIEGNYGTSNFQAPEIFLNNSFDGEKADVWACGIFLLSLLTGKLPFEMSNANDKDAVDAIQQQILTNIFKFPEYLSEDVIDLLKLILINEPSQRISLKMIMDHKWVRKDGARATGKLLPPSVKRVN